MNDMTTNTNAPLVRMGETDPDALVTAAMRERYAMPAVVVAALKQSGKRLAVKLMTLIESDDFDRLPIDTQLKITEFVFDRAFGKSESASSSLALQHRIRKDTGEIGDSISNSKRLKELDNRVQFPEMRKIKSAALQSATEKSPDGMTSSTPNGGDGPRRVSHSRAEGLKGEVIEMPKYFKKG